MLELGRPGSAGADRGERPVLEDGEVVAALQASSWGESATAAVGGSAWVFTSSWELDLEGRSVEMGIVSHWQGTHRYTSGGRTVAESGTTGGWAARPTLTAGTELPLHHQVFLLWLELVLQRRAAAAAAA